MAQPKSKKTMEERLAHIGRRDNGAENPGGDNLAKLLLKALKSKDNPTVEKIINIDEQLIVRAVQRLPNGIIHEMLGELTDLIQQRRNLYRPGSLWLKHLTEQNASILKSSPKLPELSTCIEKRINYGNSLKALRTKVQFFLKLQNQIGMTETEEIQILNERDLSDSDEFLMYESPKEEFSESEEEISEDEEEMS